jgi:lipopolysaccharide transport system ATP-binding protein
MSDVAIRVENLGKLYRLGEIGTGTLSHDLNRAWARLRGKEDPFAKVGETNDRTTRGNSDFVWSLKDVNFEVKQGEVLGIIGRNGAGKSTLLKILSKVTAPTTGRIKVKGRIASLLEVGTGFHPELTGRENVYLNGAILGMTKAEIRSKFDEIVDFSGVERYIDTPVKRYSSGMYVRLAFAVAGFLEPEVLIIDEVLAVGDAEFQKKCLGRMKDVSVNDGRTVLFVSHNMAAVSQLCSTTISLANGRVREIGETSRIVANYLNSEGSTDALIDLKDISLNRTGNRKVEFDKIYLTGRNDDEPTRIFSLGQTVLINLAIKVKNPNESIIQVAIELKTSEGMKIANMIDKDSGFRVTGHAGDYLNLEVAIPDIRLYPDTYVLSFYAGDLSSSETYDYVEDCLSFEIVDGGTLTSRVLPRAAGLLFLTPTWKNK